VTVIGIDTAGRLGGIGIVSEGRLLGAEVLGVEEGHSQNVLPALESLMRALGLGPGAIDGIAVSIGPGSYTGLRIGVAVAKGLAYAWGVPVRGVSTLLATAWPLGGVRGVICASLDARKEHVFSAIFRGPRLGSSEVEGEAAIDGRGTDSAKRRALVPEAVVAVEDRRSVEEVVEEIKAFLGAGEDVYLVGDGAPIVHRRLVESLTGSSAQDRQERPEEKGEESSEKSVWSLRREYGLAGRGARAVLVPLQGDGLRAAHVAHIGEIELSGGAADDPFELSPNYLRRSEAERRWRQSLS